MLSKKRRIPPAIVRMPSLDKAWDGSRERIATVTFDPKIHPGSMFFHFNYDNGDWMRVTSLSPIVLAVRSGTVEVRIERGGRFLDGGSFVVDIENKTITPVGFKRCFLKIRGRQLREIPIHYLLNKDVITLSGVQNGAYGRARTRKERGDPTILTVFTPPEIASQLTG